MRDNGTTAGTFQGTRCPVQAAFAHDLPSERPKHQLRLSAALCLPIQRSEEVRRLALDPTHGYTAPPDKPPLQDHPHMLHGRRPVESTDWTLLWCGGGTPLVEGSPVETHICLVQVLTSRLLPRLPAVNIPHITMKPMHKLIVMTVCHQPSLIAPSSEDPSCIQSCIEEHVCCFYLSKLMCP